MRILKPIRLIWTFYSAFAVPSAVITLTCLTLYIKSDFRIFPIIFWFKSVTLGVMFMYVNSYMKHEYFYYQNLGISKVTLWSSTLAFDFLLFLFLSFLSHKIV